MSEWLDIAASDELEQGDARLVETQHYKIAVFNIDGEYFAIEDTCSHEQFPLLGSGLNSSELLRGKEIMCPRHGARFCLQSGAALCPPAYEALTTFPVRVKDGIVQLRLSQGD